MNQHFNRREPAVGHWRADAVVMWSARMPEVMNVFSPLTT
jgi:hypothetical protein